MEKDQQAILKIDGLSTNIIIIFIHPWAACAEYFCSKSFAMSGAAYAVPVLLGMPVAILGLLSSVRCAESANYCLPC